MDTYRKTNVAFLLVSIALFGVATLSWFSSCFDGVCLAEFEFGVLQPLMYASIWLVGVFTLFLFFESQYFGHWLSKIFSWLSLCCFIVIVVAFPTSFFGQDYINRNVATHFMGFLTLAVSIGFLVLMRYKNVIAEYATKGNVLYINEVQKTTKWFLMIVFSFSFYLFTPLYCGGQYYCSYHRDTISSASFGLLLCVPIITYLLSFNIVVFLRWIRHIAWWYAIFVPWALGDESGSFLTPSEMIVTILVVVLFVITLIYAPVTSRYIRKTYGLPGAGIWQFRFATSLFLFSTISFLIVFLD